MRNERYDPFHCMVEFHHVEGDREGPVERRELLNRWLQAGESLTARSAAERLGVSAKTVRRDLHWLQSRGAPLAYDESAHTWRYTEDTFELTTALVRTEDVLAFALVRQTLLRYRGTPLADAAVEALDRLAAVLPERERKAAAWALDRVVFSGRPPAVVPEAIWTDVLTGLRDRKSLRLEYGADPADTRTLRFDPYGLIARDGDWFLYGLHHGHDANRTLNLVRVRSVEITPWAFRIPDDFDLARYTGDGFGGLQRDGAPARTVRLHFPADLAHQAVERPWHRDQRVEWQEDGSVVVEFEATYLEGVRREVAGWEGADVFRSVKRSELEEDHQR